MARRKPSKGETVQCQHFTWRLNQRHGIYYADGRSNTPKLGRHSLGVTSREEVMSSLIELDLSMAIKTGRIQAAAPVVSSERRLSIDEGIQLYIQFVGRSPVIGGVRKRTLKRYTCIAQNFKNFLAKKNVMTWNEVSTQIVESYAGELDHLGRAAATTALEMTTVKQIYKYLVDAGRLPPNSRLNIRIQKPRETTRYCWRDEEVAAMVDHCEKTPGISWLKPIIIGLTCTGLRIRELLGLRWSDVKFEEGMICLTDESTHKSTGRERREIKNHSSRTLPIHPELGTALDGLARTSLDLLYLSPKGNPLKYDYVQRVFKNRVLKPLSKRFPGLDGQISFPDGKLHCFRHYFCSRCANAGVPENVLMRWLGHKNSAMVKHYYHLHDDEAKRQMSAVKFLKAK